MMSWKDLGDVLLFIGVLGGIKYWFDLVEKKKAAPRDSAQNIAARLPGAYSPHPPASAPARSRTRP
jgi:hypothetical protein